MVVDHYNKFLNPVYSTAMFEFGRLAMPLFAFVLAYNLSRMPVKKMPDIMLRLFVFGALSIPAYAGIGGVIKYGWWPLNILFAFLAAVLVVWLLSIRPATKTALAALRGLSLVAFMVLGVVVEYFWAGLGLVVSLWFFFRLAKNDTWGRGLALGTACLWFALLNNINGNYWALMAVPIIGLGWLLPIGAIKLPRFKWFFYWFYPAHLSLIWFIGFE